MRAYKFRLYPSRNQEKQMNTHLWISKELWNEMLSFTKETYKNYGKFATKMTLRTIVKQSGLFSQVGQELVDRLLDALDKKIQMKRNGLKSGFPRFKSFDRMKSLVYPQFGFSLEKKLKVTPFGEISIRKHREIEGEIKTLTLKREASGKWFAIFCVKQSKRQPKKNIGEKVGIDLGLKNFATLSNGTVIGNPRHFKKHEERLAFMQRRLSRCVKRSKNRIKARRKIEIRHEKVANCRRDFLHKLSASLVDSYSLIAVEKLAPQDMAEQRYGKSINDAGWNMFVNMLAYKAEEAGCKILLVNPENTTKICSRCGIAVEKTLRDRRHDCPSCGLCIDRDLNAAINILNKATVGTTGSNASGDEITISSLKEEATCFIGW